MNGIHEVTGSIPVWSTNPNLLIYSYFQFHPNRLWNQPVDLTPIGC